MTRLIKTACFSVCNQSHESRQGISGLGEYFWPECGFGAVDTVHSSHTRTGLGSVLLSSLSAPSFSETGSSSELLNY